MKQINHIQITNIDEDINPLELSAYRREQEDQDNEHPNEFYCGICGWVPIEVFPHCH